MAIGGAFEPYLQLSLMMLLQAAQTRAPEDDEELIDYVNILREGILEGYTGIVQGLKDGNRSEVLLPYIEAIMGFLELLANDRQSDFDNEVLSKAVGLIGDIASALGSQIKVYLGKPYIIQLIKDGNTCGDQSIMGTSQWAMGVVTQAMA